MDEPQIITLDLRGGRNLDDMHRRIKIAFDFPDYYGENWNAFWDLLRGMGDNTLVEIHGIASLPPNLKAQAEKMLVCLDDNIAEMAKLKQRRPDFDCRFAYRCID